MTTPLQDILADALDSVREERSGKIPELPQTSHDPDPDALAAAAMSVDGTVVSAGDESALFTIQSMSKALVYAMALESAGAERVAQVVDVEPSGESYDVISLESETNRPDNPMINAGAMVVHSLVGGVDAEPEERSELVLDVLSRLAGRPLEVDEAVFEEEFASAHRNLAIAHMLRAFDGLPDEPTDVVRGYLRQCAVSVTVKDLAAMAATLCNRGVQPVTGERIFSVPVVRQTLSVMLTCGMYESAGDWVSEVGIPAKSGVSGGIIGAVPGRGGIATYSPRLDSNGNSVRGQMVFEQLSDRLGLHFVDAQHEADERWARAVDATG